MNTEIPDSSVKPVVETNQDNNSNIETEQESDEESIMSNDNTKLEFTLGKEDWVRFQERLEFYFISKDITEDKKKVSVMLTRVNEEAFQLFKQLCSPEKLIHKSYANLNKMMTANLNPKPSKVMERCKFNQAH